MAPLNQGLSLLCTQITLVGTKHSTSRQMHIQSLYWIVSTPDISRRQLTYCITGCSPVLMVIWFWSFLLLLSPLWLKIVMVLGTMSEIFRSLQWKLCPWHAFEVHESSALWWLSTFIKGITSDNKLMNLCEIGLFYKLWDLSKGTRDNY